MTDRKHGRVPTHVQVSYRTTGSFLVAYSVNLSKGGIFIEAEPLPIGTEVHLELDVPAVGKLDVDGVVAWAREENTIGLPTGMGIQFAGGLDERHGAAIDQLVSSFEGLEILVMGSAERRSLIVRFLTSIMACETVEAEALETAGNVIIEGVELAIVDLDTAGEDGREAIQMARAGERPTPVITIAANAEMQRWAIEHGLGQPLRSPPTFGDLQNAVLAALSRPTSKVPGAPP